VPDNCYGYVVSYQALNEAGKVRIVEDAPEHPVPIPASVAPRMSNAHARGVNYVFEDAEGWIVMFNNGEFGGGIEWYAKSGGPPKSIDVVEGREDGGYQNVNRAMSISGRLYVLQGIAHGTLSEGQLAVFWREHDHFSSHVIAKFRSEPIDWIPFSDGSWLVATWEAIWRISNAGTIVLEARISEAIDYPSSFIGTPDGTLYVGGRSGVLRLTPMWPDLPRYALDMLLPTQSDQHKCWLAWKAAHKKVSNSRK